MSESPWEICTCTGNESCSLCPSPLDLWLRDLIVQREGETDGEHLERIKDELTIELDEDV